MIGISNINRFCEKLKSLKASSFFANSYLEKVIKFFDTFFEEILFAVLK